MAQSNSFATHYQKGLEFYQGGHYEEALSCLKKAIILQVDFFDAYYLIARIYEELDQYDDALSMYKKVLDLIPNDLEVLCNYGKILLKAGAAGKGIRVLKKVIRRNKKETNARLALARFYFRKGKFSKALSLMDTGIKAAPECAEFYSLAGDILRRQKKNARAQQYYENCLEVDPNFEPAKRGISAVYRAMENNNGYDSHTYKKEAKAELIDVAELYSAGEYDRAIIRLLDLKDQPGVEREASMLLGMTFVRKGLFKRARDVLLSFAREHSPDLLVLYNLGLASNRMGRYEEAVHYLSGALEQDEEYPEALIEMGMACQMTGDRASAKYCLVQALKIDRADPRPFAYLARLAYDLGDQTKAMEFLRHAIKMDSSLPEVTLIIGYIAIHEGNFEKAVKNLKRCLNQSPDHFEAHKLMGQALMELGDLSAAADAYRFAAALNPADPECAQFLVEYAE